MLKERDCIDFKVLRLKDLVKQEIELDGVLNAHKKFGQAVLNSIGVLNAIGVLYSVLDCT